MIDQRNSPQIQVRALSQLAGITLKPIIHTKRGMEWCSHNLDSRKADHSLFTHTKIEVFARFLIYGDVWPEMKIINTLHKLIN